MRTAFWLMFGLCGGLILGLSMQTAQAGKGVGEDAAYARQMGFESRFFYVASGNGEGQLEYICLAYPGTIGSDDTADDVWQVQRFTYDSSNRLSTIRFAGDDDQFNQRCDDRVGLEY